MKKQRHITFKVWLEIERYNDRTSHGQTLRAIAVKVATFGTYEEALDYAKRVTSLADSINL